MRTQYNEVKIILPDDEEFTVLASEAARMIENFDECLGNDGRLTGRSTFIWNRPERGRLMKSVGRGTAVTGCLRTEDTNGADVDASTCT